MFRDFRLIRCRLLLQAGGGGLDFSHGRKKMIWGEEIKKFFYKMWCLYPREACWQCRRKNTCFYAAMFAPSAALGALPAEAAGMTPYPFVLEPPPSGYYRPREKTILTVYLLGRGMSYLPYFLEGIKDMGLEGVGRGRKTFTLQEAWLEHPLQKKIFPLARFIGAELAPGAVLHGWQVENWAAKAGNVKSIMLNFTSPAFIRYQNAFLVEPEFKAVLKELVGRLSSLYYYYHMGKEIKLSYQCFISGGEKIEIVKNNTRTVFLENKSAPSQGLRSVGFIGKVFYQGELTPYLPVLKMGEYLHLGEGSHLGQGALRLHFSGIYFEPRQ